MSTGSSFLFVDDQVRHLERICPGFDFRTPVPGVTCLQPRPFRYDTLGYPKAATASKEAFKSFASKVHNPALRRFVTAVGALSNGEWEVDITSGLTPGQMQTVARFRGEAVVFDLDGTLQCVDRLWGASLGEASAHMSSLTGGKITRKDVSEFYLGGAARAARVVKMLRSLRSAGVDAYVLTSNGHANVERYVSDMFKSLGHAFPEAKVHRTASAGKQESLRKIMTQHVKRQGAAASSSLNARCRRRGRAASACSRSRSATSPSTTR